MLKKFGSHYAIERFGVIFVSLVACMCILVGSIFANKIKSDRKILTGQAIYTQQFAMSQSGDVCSIKGLYVSDDKTKCFISMQFPSMDNLSMDAKDYAIYLTGSDASIRKTDLKSRPDARLYVFGNTGLMGLYLYEPTGFPSQIVSVMLQCMKNYSGAVGDAGSVNQGQFFINPGGEFATHAEFLNNKDWTVAQAYEEINVRSEEKVIRTQLRNDLFEMRNQKLLINAAIQRLENYDIMSPELPEEIAGDKFFAINPNDADMSELSWSSDRSIWFNADDQSEQYSDDEVHLYLNPQYVLSGGYNFNWQNTYIRDGFLKELTGLESVTEWNDYFSQMSSKQSDDEFDLDDIKFYYTNGKEFTDTSATQAGGSTKRSESIANNIKAFEDACSAYYEAKNAYQREHLLQLLQIECNMHDVTDTYTCNSNEDGSLVYYY